MSDTAAIRVRFYQGVATPNDWHRLFDEVERLRASHNEASASAPHNSSMLHSTVHLMSEYGAMADCEAAPVLRRMLRREVERREQAEAQVAALRAALVDAQSVLGMRQVCGEDITDLGVANHGRA